MSNSLKFSKPGMAKISWNMRHNDEQLNNYDLESLELNINNDSCEIDLSQNSHELEIDRTMHINMKAMYNGYGVKTKDLVVEIDPLLYYGSIQIGNNPLWDEGGEEIIPEFINSMTIEQLRGIADRTPIEKILDNKTIQIAHVGQLVRDEAVNSTNRTYGFYGASSDITSSYPVIIYPTYVGEIESIVDGTGAAYEVNSDDNLGFYCDMILLDGIEYYVYILKNPNSTKETGEPIYITFKPSK